MNAYNPTHPGETLRDCIHNSDLTITDTSREMGYREQRCIEYCPVSSLFPLVWLWLWKKWVGATLNFGCGVRLILIWLLRAKIVVQTTVKEH